MSYTGTILQVETTNAGSNLVGDHTSGAGTITVGTLADFDLTGGTVTLTDEAAGVPVTQTIAYTAGDIETGVLTLTGTLSSNFTDGTEVSISPAVPTTYAYVATEDTQEPLPAVVSQELRASYVTALREGVRDGDGAIVLVEEVVDEEWRVVTVIGEPAEINGSAISPTTPIPVTALTDGLPPSGSPTVTVTTFAVGAVRATWPAQANADPVTYDVYASLTSPVTTSSEMVTSTPSRDVLISKLAGVDLPTNAPTYVRVVARDADGAAAIGTQGSATARRATTTDIDTAYTALITAAQSTANTAQTTADGKNKVIYSTSTASGTTGYVNGDIWFRRSGEIIIEQWEFRAGTWVAKTLDNAVIANLNAAKITAGFLDAARIQTNSLTADKVLIGSLDNLVPDPYFKGTNTWTMTSATILPTGSRNGGPAMRVNGSPGFAACAGFRVEAGAQFRAGAVFKAAAAIATNIAGVWVEYRNSANTQIGVETFGAPAAAAGVWTTFSAIATAPANTHMVYVYAISYQDATFDSVFFTRAANGQLIVDGSVTADKISAHSIGADQIATDYLYAGTVEASQITTGVINALTKIFVGSSIVISQPSVSPAPISGGIEVLDPANPSGDPLVRLHPEGCSFKGKVSADILTVLQDLIINGAASLSSGGTFTLKNGVSDPTVGPVHTQGPINQMDWPAPLAGCTRRGICWDATNSQWIELFTHTATKATRYRSVSTTGSVTGGYTSFGASISGLGLGSVSFNRVTSVTTLGADIYVTAVYVDGLSNEFPVLHKSTLTTGTATAQVLLGSINVAAGGDPAVGNDGTSLFAVYIDDGTGTPHRCQKFNTSLVSAGYAVLNNGAAGPSDVRRFVGVGDFGYGASKLTVAHDGKVDVYPLPTFTADTVARDTALSFDLDASLSNGGIAYKTNGTNQAFYSNHNDGKWWKWSTYYPAAGELFWSKYEDTGAGAVHTAASPVTSIAVGKRRFAGLTFRAAPTGVTGVDAWTGYGSSLPGTFYKRPESATGRVMLLTALKDTSGSTSVPAGNTFGGSAAVLQSELGGFSVSGAGAVAAPKQDQRIIPTLANNTVITTEIIVAQWALPADYLIALAMYEIKLLGQVSGAGTLTWRIRCGPLGTAADPLVIAFAASAAGAANAHVSTDFLVECLTAGAAGTVTGGGRAYMAGSPATIVGPATGAFAAASVDTTLATNKLSVSCVQSVAQTLTVRGAVLNRLRG